jgi:4-carboxymuconolactone decarboxylase
MSDKQALRDKGRTILREMIGEDYFSRREKGANGFNKEFHQLSEEYCFGEIWGRSGLAPKFRSMLCIAMLVALNRPAQLQLHVKSALKNGSTVDEIKEVLLQTVIYCGLPAAVEGFRNAEEALQKEGLL